ncbi:MAG: exonuclease SbcCD subunit D [Nanoarchaeota archaeon]|nr:exonuclease SbcCD subunit D [Nanoarchaeota archaeon]
MKYAHLADLHLGSWREPKMRDLSTKAFLTAIDQCIENQVDFILFAGDIFNTSLPSLDTLKIVTKKIKELKDQNIPLYVIAGSHDFSPSGKTMIDVLENAGLLKNVCRGKIHPETKELHLQFCTDPKTGTKLTGILGRKGQLDKTYYQNLHLADLEQESGYKIFMFHTTLSEMKPKHLEKIESQPASFLPKNFNYYAGGHIHHPTKIELEGYGTLTYPGALFPNNFAEVEKYSHGGYYLITVENNSHHDNQKVEWVPLKVMQHHALTIPCSNRSPEVITFEILNYFEKVNIQDIIITIRLSGTLAKGKVSDINFNQIFAELYRKGAYFIMKNTAGLQSEEFEEIKTSASDPETMEEEIIKEHLQQNKLYDAETELSLTKTLLNALTTSKKEGETLSDFQERIIQEISKILNV